MRLLALLEDPAGPSARLRFEPFARRLEAEGASVERVELARGGWRRWRQLAAARRFDVVFLQRRLLQPFESAWLRAHARRLVVDVDDALWRRDHAPFESWTRRARARALLRRADVVLAGSRTLARELASLGVAAIELPTPARERAPVPTSAGAASRAPTLCWIGQPATWRYMEEVAPAWTAARAARGDARLLVVGSGVPSDRRFPGAEHRAWSEVAEAAALAESDVGLAPLSDDPWTRGKCAARLLTCLSAGVVTVASPVGAQRELAEEAGGVVLAENAERFAAATVELLRDPTLRARLLEPVARRLAASRSVESLLARFRAAVDSATGRAPAPGDPRVARPGEAG